MQDLFEKTRKGVHYGYGPAQAAEETGTAEGKAESLQRQSDKGSLLEVDGTDTKSGQPARLVGVAVPHGGQTWFFKMIGDTKVVAREKDAFIKFVQNTKFPNAP